MEDVNVCPYCKKADKLIDYDKEKRGEAFECNDNSKFSGHIKKDAYSMGDEDADTVYGNKTRHDLDNCENSDNYKAPAQKPAAIAVLEKLSPEEKRRLIAEKQLEIRMKYGNNPSADSLFGATINVNGEEMSVEDFRRYIGNRQLPDNRNSGKKLTEQELKTIITLIVVAIFLLPFLAPVSVVLFVIAITMGTSKNKK